MARSGNKVEQLVLGRSLCRGSGEGFFEKENYAIASGPRNEGRGRISVVGGIRKPGCEFGEKAGDLGACHVELEPRPGSARPIHFPCSLAGPLTPWLPALPPPFSAMIFTWMKVRMDMRQLTVKLLGGGRIK